MLNILFALCYLSRRLFEKLMDSLVLLTDSHALRLLGALSNVLTTGLSFFMLSFFWLCRLSLQTSWLYQLSNKLLADDCVLNMPFATVSVLIIADVIISALFLWN